MGEKMNGSIMGTMDHGSMMDGGMNDSMMDHDSMMKDSSHNDLANAVGSKAEAEIKGTGPDSKIEGSVDFV